ncbi:hypothetical protein MMC29_001175 [Sticta canariensis]|nr:hypothetical protein [Sticta canariensis]
MNKYISLATEFDERHKLVAELAVEYTADTSFKELVGDFEQKVSGSGGKVSYQVYPMVEVERPQDTSSEMPAQGTPGRNSGAR